VEELLRDPQIATCSRWLTSISSPQRRAPARVSIAVILATVSS